MKPLATVLVSSFVIAASVMGASPVFAQTDAKICLTLSTNVSYGMQDAHTDGNVARLQDFLATNGYFDRNLMGSLRFGPATRAAVIKFQASHSLPQTGFISPRTRAAISSVSCGTTPPSSNVSLYFLTPASGAVGTTVLVTGFGFTANNTILMDGSVAARNVPITSSIAVACTTDPSCKGGIRQTLQFTIPDSLSPNCPAGSMCPMYLRLTTPGTYAITVQNDHGTSAPLTLTVTST
jgi:peptidoglycan hydrolase-like protein with peptidoglycan-binding domain